MHFLKNSKNDDPNCKQFLSNDSGLRQQCRGSWQLAHEHWMGTRTSVDTTFWTVYSAVLCIMSDQDLEKLFKFAKNGINSVCKNPIYTYHSFINVFCFVNHKIKLQEAVGEAQRVWTRAKHESGSHCDQSPAAQDIYDAGLTRMRRLQEKPNTMLAFLAKKVGLCFLVIFVSYIVCFGGVDLPAITFV